MLNTCLQNQNSYICYKISSIIAKIANMTTKIKQILDIAPRGSVLFSSWLTAQNLDAKAQYSYMKRGWLTRISKGVYKLNGITPTLLSAISSYNSQLGKHCIIGAHTALEMRGYSHYLPMGKPTAYLFTEQTERLPKWLLEGGWEMNVRYMTTSFLGDDLLGVETMTIDHNILLVSSAERAILECLNLPDASSSLVDIYHIMEGLTTLRPKLMQTLLENCTSVKVKRLFLYMAEKANHSWLQSLNTEKISLGTSRFMVTSTGKFIRKYNMTISKELAEYE